MAFGEGTLLERSARLQALHRLPLPPSFRALSLTRSSPLDLTPSTLLCSISLSLFTISPPKYMYQ